MEMSQHPINTFFHMQTNISDAPMSKPLFVYEVTSTSWCIIVTENAGHFYFDTATKKSVWQLNETGLAPERFVANVNFDDLGLLFARANGVEIEEDSKPENTNKKNLEEQEIIYDESEESNSDVNGESEDEDGNEMLRQLLGESGLLPEEEIDSNNSESVNESNVNGQQENSPQTSTGLALGYSSLEDDSEEEDDQESGNGTFNSVIGGDDEPNHALDLSIEGETETKSHEPKADGLDLSITETSVSSEDTAKFIALLEKHRSAISIYDPWFVVEEELLAEFAQDPTFYVVPENQRESIFNQWVLDTTLANKLSLEATYPTPELRYFQFLQEHKSEVRKQYYAEFYRTHASEFKTMDFGHVKTEDEFRRLRVTLNDFAQYERSAKKMAAAGASSNLKLEHVRDFVSKSLASHKFEPLEIPASGSWFDRWIDLCNLCNLPPKVVNDPTNFIVGDEKRFACYMSALQRT